MSRLQAPGNVYKIKHEIIYHNCLACGAREPCDMQHKLTTYILKQHKIEKKARRRGGGGRRRRQERGGAADGAGEGKEGRGRPLIRRRRASTWQGKEAAREGGRKDKGDKQEE